MLRTLPLILFTMLLNAAAQMLLKAGMNRIGFFSFSWANVGPIAWQVVTNPFIMTGIFIYVISISAWLAVLSRVDVGVAYPLTSLAYILTAIAGYYYFGEPLSFARILGIIIILIGVYLVAQT